MRRLAFALALLLPLAAGAVEVTPNPVRITAWFDGTTVHVKGTTEPGAHVFVRVTAATSVTEEFDRKGHLGPLWANVGKVKISGAPRFFLVAGSAPADTVLERAKVDEHLLDLDAAARMIQIEPQGPDDQLLQKEYVKLKRSGDFYAVDPRAVALGGGAGSATFDAAIAWPDNAPVGEYVIDVFHVLEGAVIRSETASLRVEMAGLPAWIADLAFKKSALYGVLSVVIAIAVGFIIGLIFKRKGGGGGH